MSDWMTEDDSQIDIAVTSVFSYFQDTASLATSNALIGLGLMLRSRRSTRRARPPMQAFEYCECCDRYSERYQNSLHERHLVGYQGLVHPEITPLLILKSSGSHRFCSRCGAKASHSLKWAIKKRSGANRGDLKFARMLSEDHLHRHFDPREFFQLRRIQPGFEEELRGFWPWTARAMARILSSRADAAQSSAAARIRLLCERGEQQNEFIIGVMRSLLPPNQKLPYWLVERTSDFAHVELCTLPQYGSNSLYLIGYGRRGVRRTRVRSVAPSYATANARQAFLDLTAKIGITARNSIEFELPQFHTHFRAELQEGHVNVEAQAQMARTVPAAFQNIVRTQLQFDAARHSHCRFYCQVERPFSYQRLLDHLRTSKS